MNDLFFCGIQNYFTGVSNHNHPIFTYKCTEIKLFCRTKKKPQEYLSKSPRKPVNCWSITSNNYFQIERQQRWLSCFRRCVTSKTSVIIVCSASFPEARGPEEFIFWKIRNQNRSFQLYIIAASLFCIFLNFEGGSKSTLEIVYLKNSFFIKWTNELERIGMEMGAKHY